MRKTFVQEKMGQMQSNKEKHYTHQPEAKVDKGSEEGQYNDDDDEKTTSEM